MLIKDIKPIDAEVKSHFLNLYSMALSDTEVDTAELQMLYKFGQERGIQKEEIEQLILYPDSVKFTIPQEITSKIEYLYDFARMAWADGKIDEDEIRTLEKFCLKFGFDESNVFKLTTFLMEEAKKETSKTVLLTIVEENL